MTEAIQMQSISKRFPRERGWGALLPWRNVEYVTAVDDVSLDVHQGEFFGLLGPNGAGKTTLIKMLCGLVLPSQGQATIQGLDVVREADAVRELIALVDGQERSFFWRLSGRENLEFFAALYGLHGAVAHKRVQELLALVSLLESADRRFMTYSTGMRQRLAIARGLLRHPQVLFMDEPTRSLDPLSAREVRDFARLRLVDQLGCTVVWCTHYLQEAEDLCDRVAILKRGQVIACETVTRVKELMPVRAACQLRVAGLSGEDVQSLADLPLVQDLTCTLADDGLLALDLLLADEPEAMPAVLEAVIGLGGHIYHCTTRQATLEEAFAYLVNGGSGA